jgi:hypothetical protein
MTRKTMLDAADAFALDIGASIGFTPNEPSSNAGYFLTQIEAALDFQRNSDAEIGRAIRRGAALDSVVAEVRTILDEYNVEDVLSGAYECPETALNLASLFLTAAARINRTCADYGVNALMVHNAASDPAA